MRTSGRRLWPLVGAGAVALALGAATALGGELKRTSSTEPVPVDSQAHYATATCPAGHKVTGGGAQLAEAAAIQGQDGSFPLNKREWTASGISFLGDPSEVTAHAICLRGAKVKLASESIALGELSGPAEAVTATCPRGTKASGGGLEVDQETTAGVAGSYPSGKRKWTAVAYPSPGDELTAHAVCLKHRKLKHKEKTVEIPAGFDTVTAITVTCKKRTKPTGGGAELDPDETFYLHSYPDGKRGWTVEAQSGSGSEMTAHVLCLKKQKK